MPRNEAGGGGVSAWMKRSWRPLLAELLSTALLVGLGVGSAVNMHKPPLTHPALGFGFAVLINAEAFGGVSGAHMNPAVTLAALVYGRLGAALAAGYVLAQLLGAALGFGALLALLPRALTAAPAGCTLPHVAPLAALVVEALLTAALVLLACGIFAAHDDRNPDRTASIKFAFGIAGLVFTGGPMTGASLNPARSFGPALLQGVWDHHWVYWVGPMVGAALAALLHRFVLSPPRAAPAPSAAAAALAATTPAELLPLHIKQ